MSSQQKLIQYQQQIAETFVFTRDPNYAQIERLLFRFRGINRKMLCTSPALSADHLTTTIASTRQEVISPATVMEISNLSETVKMLTLQISNRDFCFKAGQWIDTFIPGLETVGGYSLCSSPALLKEKGLIVLAIKFSKHPPAFWVHTKCKQGDQILVRAGGDFAFDPDPGVEQASDVLLIAGGVGINPLYSMLNHVAHINSSPQGPYRGNVRLLFSAKTCSELIFKTEMEALSASHPNINTQFFVTRESTVPDSLIAGRISHADIQRATQELKPEKLQVYMCGPAPMIHEMEEHCFKCKLTKEQLFYERWW